ncbi:hypothetical protein A2619_04765 [candidate division WWE3 bacterium RIFOXYD1_FULL_39_9]|uniref:Glycosyltransferase RgtA/B/C/D-like domain-containing protein n=1 Tax=candidate division WWE3 bacterium RIFOXYD1_FULL_39_9 TaxID=1802649 RepID=A0A1F4X6J2_UNCKA|nr:MAG: hypothetical protein A2619_04765 [candidate division WWE3 bacterium RIFOXYD1_FULL_39_9]
MRRFFAISLTASVIYFLSWAFVYSIGVNKLAVQSEDTVPAIFLPISIISRGDLYLDNYYSTMLGSYPHPDDKSYTRNMVPFYLRKVDTHYVSAFPIITPILAVPVYLLPVLLNLPMIWGNLIILSHVAAALIVGFSGGFMYLLLKKHFETSNYHALLITAIYLFGTINYALLSQALWQHGTLQLFLIIGLYFYLNYLKDSRSSHMLFTGLFFGLAFLSRPTGGLPIILIVTHFLFTYRANLKKLVKPGILFLIGLLLVAGFFFWYNAKFYRDISNQGYSSQLTTNWLGGFPESFFGVWFSPSKGILAYSPVFVFSLIGLYLGLRRRDSKSDLYLIFGITVFLHTLIISFWKHWYGGWSFGYRMSSDVIPFLILLLVPFVQSDHFTKYKKVFYVIAGLSVYIQLLGIVFFDGIWHAAYDKGFTDTSWLWSLKDSELVFNVRRVMVKLGLLAKACAQCLPQK